MTDRPNPTTAFALKVEDLVLPCAADEFVNWLIYHTRDTASQPLYTTDQAQLTLYPAEQVPVRDRAGYHKVQQLARYITYRKDGQPLQEGTAPAIDAEVVALGADRCEVHLVSLLRGTDGYLDALVDEIRKRWLADTKAKSKQAHSISGTVPDWLPKKQQTLDKWRQVYDQMREYRKHYYATPEAIDSGDTEPHWDEMRDEVLAVCGLKYREKRLQQIWKAGEKGWLK
jgi:hypothetical protein